MSWVLLIALVIILALTLAVVIGRNDGSSRIGYPYQPSKWLFSEAERSFLGVLDQAVGREHRVLGKVRLGDLAQVKSGLSRSAHRGALNRIAAKHIDFVVCRASDLAVICAIELNDKSHANKRTQSRDELVTRVCSAISLPLIMFPAKHTYVVNEVRDAFLAATNLKPQSLEVGT
jgi:Protein of unknown function (DUF2726)